MKFHTEYILMSGAKVYDAETGGFSMEPTKPWFTTSLDTACTKAKSINSWRENFGLPLCKVESVQVPVSIA